MRIPMTPPPWQELIKSLQKSDSPGDRLIELASFEVGAAPNGQYYHWDTFRHLSPPNHMTTEEWWLAVKFARSSITRHIPLRDVGGHQFKYSTADPLLQRLHEIDRDASGQLTTSDEITNPHTRDRYIQSSLIEEAITSSQLEGAASTREVAKEMIRSGRDPIDKSETMILNNYRAIQLIAQYKDRPLSTELVFEIHRAITQGTLDSEGGPNHLRQPGDGIRVYDSQNQVLHDPPPADALMKRMEEMCQFANDAPVDAFLHPVVKAIILHFWLAYDHPFVDGNGRTARALFYWSMLAQGYWLFEFISISRILLDGQAKYGRSFLYTETDDNDLTYFILYQLKVICRAIEELKSYIQTKTKDIRRIEQVIKSVTSFNHRQLALLGHALRHPGFKYSIRSHRNSHGVTYQTARTDLLDLASEGLLSKSQAGRRFVFVPHVDLENRLKNLASSISPT